MDKTIKVHNINSKGIRIEPAPVQRDWMGASVDRFAYRCLPLNIANAHGWQILNPAGFRVRMVGERGKEHLEFEHETPDDPPAISHFGMGIVTFHVPAVFTTPPGVSLYVTGPVNHTVPGMSPLTGIVETDWLPFTFTMNWRLTVKNHWLTFEKDRPFCMVFPVRPTEIEDYSLEISDIREDPELTAKLEAYAAGREAFLKDLQAGDEDAVAQKWQKTYFQGPAGSGPITTHRTSLKLAQPKWAQKPDQA